MHPGFFREFMGGSVGNTHQFFQRVYGDIKKIFYYC